MMDQGNKKFISAVMTVILLLVGVFSYPELLVSDVHAAYGAESEEKYSGNYFYIVNSAGTAEITAYTGTDTKVDFPETIDGYTVTKICDYVFDTEPIMILSDDAGKFKNKYQDDTTVTEVTIPKTVTDLEYSFYGCSKLEKVTFADGSQLKSIGRDSFARSGLKSITLPDDALCSDYSFFTHIDSLEAINVSSTNPNYTTVDGVLFSKDGKTLIRCPQGKTGAYTIPNGVETIASYAFQGCRIDEVTIPDSVTTLGGYKDYNGYSYFEGYVSQFAYCKNLRTVHLSKNIDTIAESMFEGCSNLSGIDIPDSVKSISLDAFDGTAVTALSIPKKTELVYWSHHFWYDGASSYQSLLQQFTVSAGNEYYSTDSSGVLFNKDQSELVCYPAAKSDSAYTIPSTVKRIGELGFSKCKNLKSIDMPAQLTEIGGGAFSECTGITSVTLPNTLTSIDGDAFYSCKNLASVNLPEGLSRIAEGAFMDCTSLSSVTIPASLYWMDSSSFAGCTGLTSFSVAAGNNYYSVDPYGVLFNTNNGAMDRLKSYPAGRTGEYTIPSSCYEILDHAFYGASGLTEITIPESVNIISDRAFRGCTSLKNVDIQGNIIGIHAYAFYGCTALTEINLPSSERIGAMAFTNCKKLTGITLSSDMNGIGDRAFYGCESLTSITLPTGIEYLGNGAFLNCDSLKAVAVPDSVAKIGRFAIGFKAVFQSSAVNTIGIAGGSSAKEKVSGFVYSAKSGTAGEIYGLKNGFNVSPAPTPSSSSKTSIKKLNMSLSSTKYIYNGKYKKPKVKLKNGNTVLTLNKDYSVSYSQNKKVGTAGVTVKGIGNYTGSKKLTFTIIPPGTSLNNFYSYPDSHIITWQKQLKQTSGYQLQYSYGASFSPSKAKLKTVSGSNTTQTTIKKKSGVKYYYVRIRTYKRVSNKTYYSKWSPLGRVRIKNSN